MQHDVEIARLPHFIGRRVREEAESYGPFGFLNPTVRRCSFPLRPHGLGDESEESEEGKKNGTANANANANGNGNGELHGHSNSNGNGNGNGEHAKEKKEDEVRAEDVQRLYRTRDNRKGTSLLPPVLKLRKAYLKKYN